MLAQLVERTCADIEALDMAEAVPLLWQQLKPNSSGLLAQLMRGSAKPGKPPSEESASAVTASAALLVRYLRQSRRLERCEPLKAV